MRRALNLDQRKTTLINTLLRQKSYLTGKELAKIVGAASRTVRYDIKNICDEFSRMGLLLESSPGLGYRIPEEYKNAVRAELENVIDQPATPDERMYFIIKKLLFGETTFENMLKDLNTSDSTLEKDLDRCSSWFRAWGMGICRKKDVISIKDYENRRRAAIPYYHERAACLSVHMNALLSDDFSNYPEVKKYLEEEIKTGDWKLDDYEYNCVLLYLLMTGVDGKNPEKRELENIIEELGIPEEINKDYLKHKKSIKRATEQVLKRFTSEPADEEFFEGIFRVTFKSLYKQLLPLSRENSLREVEKLYPEALRYAVALKKELETKDTAGRADIWLPDAALSFAAFRERSIVKTKKRANLICNAGPGISQLVIARLKRMFPNLEIEGGFPEYRISEAGESKPDFLITTVDIEAEIETVKINHFPDNSDFDRIVSMIRKNDAGKRLFRELLSKERFYRDMHFEKPEEVINFMCADSLKDKGADFEELVNERERIGSTAAGNLVAIPHAMSRSIGSGFIAVGVLEKAMQWGSESVQLVFLIGIDESIDMAALFDHIYSIVSNRKLVKSIITERDYSLLTGEED